MTPRSIAISHLNGDIFVVDTSNSTVRRFPYYEQIQAQLALSGTITSNYSFLAAGPRNVALDASGNVLVVDSVNRMTMHYPQLIASNWESGFYRLSPGLISRVVVPGVKLAAETVTAGDAPLPKELGGLEVLVNGVPHPSSVCLKMRDRGCEDTDSVFISDPGFGRDPREPNTDGDDVEDSGQPDASRSSSSRPRSW